MTILTLSQNLLLTSVCAADLPLHDEDDNDLNADDEDPPDLVSDSDDDDMIESFQKLLQDGEGDERRIGVALSAWDQEWHGKWHTEDAFPDPPGLSKQQAAHLADEAPLLEADGLDADALQCVFTDSEMRLYLLALKHHWTVAELKELIALLKDVEFKADDISDTMHENFQNLIKVCTISSRYHVQK